MLSGESTSFVNLTQLKKIRFNGEIVKDFSTRWIICEQLYNKFDNNWIIFILIRKSFSKYIENILSAYDCFFFFPISLFRVTKKVCQIKWFRYSDFSFLKQQTMFYTEYQILVLFALKGVSLFLCLFVCFPSGLYLFLWHVP